MNQDLIRSAETISMFCRLRMNVKQNIPIRSSEMGVLIFIQKQTELVTPLMISQFFRITKPSVTSMVNTLVKEGYLYKQSSSVDKRSVVLVMSDKGTDLVRSTFDDYYRSIHLLKSKMGEMRFAQFIDAMEEANSILEGNK